MTYQLNLFTGKQVTQKRKAKTRALPRRKQEREKQLSPGDVLEMYCQRWMTAREKRE